jgi:hypothetical protein
VDKLYYNENGIVVRKSRIQDVDYLKNHLRRSDVEEIWASHHIMAEEALKTCVEKTIFSLTIENGHPMAIFGINPETVLGEKALIWLLATDDLEKIQRRFIRHSKEFIDMMLSWYPYLYNWVDDRNKASIEWLKYCGATISAPVIHGEEQIPFRYFYFQKEKRD